MDRTFLGRYVYQVSLDQSVGLLADRLLDLDLLNSLSRVITDSY